MMSIFFKSILILIMIGAVQVSYAQTLFNNPLVEQRADPWVLKAADGSYYYTATVPEYDRIILRKSSTINGITDAEEKPIWTKHETGPMSAHIWAPELHRIDGKWYIYFAAGEVEDIWKIRIYVLSNSAQNPMDGVWKEEGQIITQTKGFALDATTFEHEEKRYLIWAESVLDGENGTGLVMSEMKSPLELTGPEVILTKPEYTWERRTHNVNEGPAVIKKNGKIFVTYSASATNQNYCVGMMWIDDNDDLFDLNNWHKSPSPVFYSNDKVGRFGPGHNSFTYAEDDESLVMIYHARDYEEIEGWELADPHRATRARVVHWTVNGFPDFRQHEKD